MRILHVFRSPVGGLFRHVRDLVKAQAELGHDVGIYCDSATGGQNASELLAQSEKFCSLGVTREAMSKLPGLGDVSCTLRTLALSKSLNVDVLHGHGAKGGLYGRLAAKLGGRTGIYTPHGGSLHYEWSTFPGPVFLGTEWLLRKTGAGMVFVCDYEKQLFERKIGLGSCKSIVVHNGLWLDEFSNSAPLSSASDLLFVGEMRHLKGVDVLLRAIALLKTKQTVTATLVGDGPDIQSFKTLAAELGLSDQVHFAGLMRMPEAINLGKIFVLPSRNESFPYVMLEAIAAYKPIIGSNVGGIGEVVPKSQLCTPDNPTELAKLIETALNQPILAENNARLLASSLKNGSTVTTMANAILGFYNTCH